MRPSAKSWLRNWCHSLIQSSNPRRLCSMTGWAHTGLVDKCRFWYRGSVEARKSSISHRTPRRGVDPGGGKGGSRPPDKYLGGNFPLKISVDHFVFCQYLVFLYIYHRRCHWENSQHYKIDMNDPILASFLCSNTMCAQPCYAASLTYTHQDCWRTASGLSGWYMCKLLY